MKRRAPPQAAPTASDDRLVLELLQTADRPLTIAMLRARGVRAPAQTLYELMVAGHDIDRVRIVGPDGHATIAYRLAGRPLPAHDDATDPDGDGLPDPAERETTPPLSPAAGAPR